MIDINLIRQKAKEVKEGISKKGYPVELVDQVLEVDQKRREVLQEVEMLRAERNKAAENKDIEKGREIKEKLQTKEPEIEKLDQKYKEALNKIPNLPASGVPEGKGEAENKVLKQVGEVPEFNFTPKDHVELGKILDIIDFDAGAKVAGNGFYYLKNEGALLELALIQYGMQTLMKKGFIPVLTPDMARQKYYLGTGYLPKGEEAQTYTVDGDELGLIATAEVTLAGYHAEEVLSEKELPKKYAGYSHCFRKEAGAYGKYSKGLYRVHQFTKLEMFAYTTPDQSVATHEEFLKLEEEFFQSLGITFRVVMMCAGDLGSQASKKYDLEAWMPGRGDFGEVTSTSNTTDYQARNLNIRFRSEDGKVEYAHLLNGTYCATSRAIIAILENYQQKDGSVVVPEVLQKYTGFKVITPKKTV